MRTQPRTAKGVTAKPGRPFARRAASPAGKRPTAELWDEYGRTRSAEARSALIEAHLPLVDKVAGFLGNRLPRLVEKGDLVSAGVFGLAGAIDKFDPSRGVKFTSYAQQRIRGAMLDWLRDVDWVPRLVRKRKEMPVKVESIERVNCRGDTRDVRTIDQTPDASVPDPSEARAQKDVVAALTAGMTRAERMIIDLYYFADVTMKEIGATLGMSESRVSQVHSMLLPRIRSRFGRGELEELLAAG